MADEEGVRQLIRMVLDEQSAKQTEKEMQDALKKGTDPKAAAGHFDFLKGKVVALGAALAAAFGLAKLIQFGRESIAAALDSRKAWGLLANAVENAGTRFSAVEARTKAVAQAFIDAGIAGDEEFAASLQTLVQVSGNFEKSLANMAVVADLAAAKHLGLEEAATLVGKAMVGNVAMFQKMGIEIPKGADAVQFLSDKFKGAADSIDPMLRAQTRLAQEWDNFKEAIGEALLAAADGQSIFDTLIGAIKAFAQTVAENQEGINAMGKLLFWFVRGAGALALELFAALALQIGVAAKAQGFLNEALIMGGELLGVNMDGFKEWTAQLDAFADAALAAAKTSNDLAATLISGKSGNAPPVSRVPRTPGGIGGAVKGAGEGTAEEVFKLEQQKRADRIRAAEEALTFDNLRQEGLLKLIDMQAELNDLLKDENLTFEQKVALQGQVKQVQDAIMSGLKEIASQAGVTEAVLERALAGDAKGTLRELAKEARGRAAWNIAKAIEEYARAAGWIGLGNFASAAAAKTSAGMHLASAAKWAALAGGATTIGGGTGRDAGGGAGAPSNLGGDAARSASNGGMVINITIDGFDPDNTQHQARVRDAQRQIRERYGEDSQYIVNGVRA